MGCGRAQGSVQVDGARAGTKLLPDPWVPTPLAPARARLTWSNSRDRKATMVLALVLVMSRLMSSRSTEEGWCLVACGGRRRAAGWTQQEALLGRGKGLGGWQEQAGVFQRMCYSVQLNRFAARTDSMAGNHIQPGHTSHQRTSRDQRLDSPGGVVRWQVHTLCWGVQQ